MLVENAHEHHIVQRVHGGDKMGVVNLILVHETCHNQLHSQGNSVVEPVAAGEGGGFDRLEPYEVKASRTVLRGLGSGDICLATRPFGGEPMNMLSHYVHPSIVSGRRPIDVALIGAGGTGSQVLSGLARMNQALKALGSSGLHVRVFDGDGVSASNVGRQLFSPADIGKNKAIVLVTRLNMFFGTNWEAYTFNVSKGLRLPGGIMISAVDDVEARYLVRDIGKNSGMVYWVDTGNTVNTGQVVLGTFDKVDQPVKSCPSYLPHVLDLYRGIMEEESQRPTRAQAVRSRRLSRDRTSSSTSGWPPARSRSSGGCSDMGR